MPKNITYVKNSDGYVKRVNMPRKHRIGNRQSTKTAEQMSIAELERLAIREESRRDRAMIEAVLVARRKALL